MVRNRIGDRDTLLCVEVLRGNASAEDLRDRIGGDETEAMGATGADGTGCPVPPVHHEVSAFGHIGDLEQRIEITVAEPIADIFATDEGRIADYEICLWPFRSAGVRVEPAFGPCALVWHALASHRMRLHRFAVPTRYWPVLLIFLEDFLIIIDQRVAVFDGPEAGQDRFVRHPLLPVYAEVPLQIADPQHQLRDLDGPRIDLQPEEVLRGDCVTGQIRNILALGIAG